MVDYPTNPPTTCYQSRRLWMLNPNVAAIALYTIRVGSPLVLRYRVVVRDGPTPTGAVDTLAAEFRGGK